MSLTSSMTSKIFAAAVLGALTFAVPATAGAVDQPATSCQNSKALAAHAKVKKANAHRDAALAKVALRKAERGSDPAHVARAETRLAAAQARLAKMTAKAHDANLQMRHNCTSPSPVTPVAPASPTS